MNELELLKQKNHDNEKLFNSIANFQAKHRQQQLDMLQLEKFINYIEDASETTLLEKKKMLVIKNNIIYILLKYVSNDIVKILQQYEGQKVTDFKIHMIKSELEFFLDFKFKVDVWQDNIKIYNKNSIFIGSISFENVNIFDDDIFNNVKNNELKNNNYNNMYISNIEKYVVELVEVIEKVRQKENELKQLKNKLNKFEIR